MNRLFSDAVAGLADFPMLGHKGEIAGTRELTPRRSYRLVYEIVEDTVWILVLIHIARQWPPLRHSPVKIIEQLLAGLDREWLDLVESGRCSLNRIAACKLGAPAINTKGRMCRQNEDAWPPAPELVLRYLSYCCGSTD